MPTALRNIKLVSLNSLRGQVSGILANNFFHVFSKEEQDTLAHSIASLLSPESGSMIFGSHSGLPEEGLWSMDPKPGETEIPMKIYCHSPESWKMMWMDIFGKGNVDVQVSLREYEWGADLFGSFPWNTKSTYEMEWSVTRC